MIGHSFPTLEEKPYNATMNKNRIIPTVGISVLVPLVLCVWVQGLRPAAEAKAEGSSAGPAPAAARSAPAAAEPAAAAPATEAELTLDEAIKKVAALPSVLAELVQSVEMLKQKFTINGTYRKAPGGRLFLKLVVSGLPGSSAEMSQVCDGVTLWDYQQLLEYKHYRKITLAPILDKLKAPELDAAAREQVLTRLGIAGPEVLLVGLRKTIHWDQKEDATLDGRPVWILRGTWQDRQGLLAPNQQPLPPSAPLPAYVPSQATLTIGKEDGWPYKLRLAGRQPTVLFDTRRVGPDGRPVGTLSSVQKGAIEPSIITLTYTLVTLDPSFKAADFEFRVPATGRVEDSTEQILSELENMIQATIAAKKAETAKGEPTLPEKITVPAPPAANDAAAPPKPPPIRSVEPK
jgi:hypothetical protein